MNPTTLSKNYDNLTPEERFRLTLAASGRGDEAERDRIARAGARLVLSFPGHHPYGQAFDELTLLVYIELLDAAAFLEVAWYRADAFDPFGEGPDDGADPKAQRAGEHRCKKSSQSKRLTDIALAASYILRTKAAGWKLFCERMNVPPCLSWEVLPGFDRLKRALDLSERTAFTPEGFLEWMKATRPEGGPVHTELRLTVERVADATAEMFRSRAEWWSG
jgi:hypothetical protein